jgi:drug/metabolite transporter (DMT)-like permease
MLFSVPLQQKQARLWLMPGMLMAVGGAWIASLGSQAADWASLFIGPVGLLPVLLAVGAAILWGVYSNVARLWAPAQGSAIPLFLLTSGGVFVALRFLAGEDSRVSWQIAPLLLYMAIFPAWLGYQLWDHAMQRGDMLLVTAFSYFSPVFSTLISMLVLKVPFTPYIAVSALLVTLGAILSKMGVVDD